MVLKRYSSYVGAASSALLLILAPACSDDGAAPDAQVADVAPAPDTDAGAPDSTKPDSAPLTSYRVAAVQYSSGDHASVEGCSDDVCALTKLVTEAARKSALLVVTPEYAFDQSGTEPSPDIGDVPAEDARWPAGGIIKSFAQLADDLNITVVFNLATSAGADRYNTSLAVDAEGKILARHYKFQLFGGEDGYLTPGPDVSKAFFETPAGKAGLLICADAQCIITGLTVTDDCTSHAVEMIKDYFLEQEPKAQVVLFSAFWTVGGSTNPWSALNVQKTVAREGRVWLVAANTTKGDGYGGGIYDPTGSPIDQVQSRTPAIVYAELPLAE